MPIRRAVEAHRSGGLNCAQSILRAFQTERGVPEDAIVQARRYGGGRAEGGRCGALHVAIELTPDPGERERMRVAFVARAGSERCREIRAGKTLSCEQCVALAATLLAETPQRRAP